LLELKANLHLNMYYFSLPTRPPSLCLPSSKRRGEHRATLLLIIAQRSGFTLAKAPNPHYTVLLLVVAVLGQENGVGVVVLSCCVSCSSGLNSKSPQLDTTRVQSILLVHPTIAADRYLHF